MTALQQGVPDAQRLHSTDVAVSLSSPPAAAAWACCRERRRCAERAARSGARPPRPGQQPIERARQWPPGCPRDRPAGRRQLRDDQQQRQPMQGDQRLIETADLRRPRPSAAPRLFTSAALPTLLVARRSSPRQGDRGLGDYSANIPSARGARRAVERGAHAEISVRRRSQHKLHKSFDRPRVSDETVLITAAGLRGLLIFMIGGLRVIAMLASAAGPAPLPAKAVLELDLRDPLTDQSPQNRWPLRAPRPLGMSILEACAARDGRAVRRFSMRCRRRDRAGLADERTWRSNTSVHPASRDRPQQGSILPLRHATYMMARGASSGCSQGPRSR